MISRGPPKHVAKVGNPEPMASITVNVVNDATDPTDGYLNVWIDFNGDGDWADPGEQIFVDEPVTDTGHGLPPSLGWLVEAENGFQRFSPGDGEVQPIRLDHLYQRQWGDNVL